MARKWLKTWVLGAIAAASVAGTAQARYIQTVQARYKTELGRSPWYTVDMTFMTGNELNMTTGTLKYSVLSGGYGIVFWKENQASVIEIDDILACGLYATRVCIAEHVLNLTGTDQEGRKWEICTASICI